MKAIGTIIITLFILANYTQAQDSLYIYKAGTVLYKQGVSNIDSVTFKKSNPIPGTVTDIDGNVYHTVTIGTQIWMVENLKTTKYRYGGAIPNVKDWSSWQNLSSGAYCNYNNVEANGLKYGRLYNWYVVNVSPIAPVGWHIPNDEEWDTLIAFLIANGGNYDGTTSGNKIGKSLAANTDWKPDTGAGTVGNDLTTNNKSGFTALPGSNQYWYGSFNPLLGYAGAWWSTTGDTYFPLSSPSIYYLSYSNSSLKHGADHKTAGYSIRCIKDK